MFENIDWESRMFGLIGPRGVGKTVLFCNTSKRIGVSRNDIGDYFLYMENAGMISQVRDATGGIMALGKVEKVYLDNTNMIAWFFATVLAKQ